VEQKGNGGRKRRVPRMTRNSILIAWILIGEQKRIQAGRKKKTNEKLLEGAGCVQCSAADGPAFMIRM